MSDANVEPDVEVIEEEVVEEEKPPMPVPVYLDEGEGEHGNPIQIGWATEPVLGYQQSDIEEEYIDEFLAGHYYFGETTAEKEEETNE